MAIKTARQINAERVVFSDIPNLFSVHPITQDLTTRKNEDSIRQSIKNLLLTDKEERLMQPDIGGNIKALLFENISPQTETALKTRIYNTIERFEPRCQLIDVLVSGDLDRNQYAVAVIFHTINSEEATQVNFVLDRVR